MWVCGTRGDIYGTHGDLVVVLKVNLVIDFGYSLALAKSNKTNLKLTLSPVKSTSGKVLNDLKQIIKHCVCKSKECTL